MINLRGQAAPVGSVYLTEMGILMPILHDGPGGHCWITVTEENGVRYLLLDGCEEGAMRLDSNDPVFNYLWFHKCGFLTRRPARLLVLGAGAFTAPKGLALDHPTACVDAVDIETELEQIGRRFFQLDGPEFRHIQFHGVSAETFLAWAPPSYDFIFDDLFDGFQHVPAKGRGAAHVDRLAGALAEGGVCLKNVIWNPLAADTRAACEETEAAWRSAFHGHAVIALGNPQRGHNRLLLGRKEKTRLDWAETAHLLGAVGMPQSILDVTYPISE